MANSVALHRLVMATTSLSGAVLALAAACGPPAKAPAAPGASAPAASSSSAAAAPAVPADATSVHIEFAKGGCSVVADDALGDSYKTAGAQEARVAEALTPALESCFASGGGRHGLLHLRAAVRADGSMTDVMVAPGGALSNELQACVAKAMAQVRLPAPEHEGGTLLLIVTSMCSQR